MANNNIKFIINVDDSGSKATIRDINGQILKTNVSVKDLNVAFKDVSKTLGLNNNALSSNAKYHENSERAIRSEINSLQSLRSNLDVSSKGYISLGNRISLLQQKLKTTSNGVDGLTRAQTQLKNSSGAASSAAMELGRVISDAPYGIRGMANNITQLVSQLGFATTAAGGFRAAMKQMWTALMGPLGVVLAITTIVSALDYFSVSQKKAKKETDETTESLKKQITPLEKLINLYSSLRKVLFTSKDSEAINAFNNNFLSLDETVKVLTRNFSEFKNAYDKLSDDDKKSKDNVKALIDGYSELLKLRELEEKQVARMSVLRDDVDKKGRTISRNGLTFLRDEAKELDNLEQSYIKTQKRLIQLDEYFVKTQEEGNSKKNKSKFSLFKTKEELDLAVKDQETALLNLSKKVEQQNLKNKEKEELLGAKTEAEKNKIKRKYAEQQLELNISYEKKKLVMSKSTERQVAKIKHDEHIETLKRTLAEYKQKVKLNNKLSDSQKEDLIGKAKTETDKLIAQAGSELIKTNEGIDDAYTPVFKLFEELAKARRDALGIFSEDDDGSQKDFDKLSFYIEQYKTIMSGVTDFVNGEFSRRLTIEENHTNALNEQLNNRLINENLSASEREKIQNQIAQNDEALRKKQNDIKKKAFNSQKAFNIATATIDTYTAAVSASKATYGGPIAKIAAMTAVIGSGLAQVAMIARQKFQPDAATTPVRTSSSGGSGGVGNRSFDFNLVGNNQSSQIADVIQGQFDKPLKAYVVSKDITNQQQLDANTKSSARFGG